MGAVLLQEFFSTRLELQKNHFSGLSFDGLGRKNPASLFSLYPKHPKRGAEAVMQS